MTRQTTLTIRTPGRGMSELTDAVAIAVRDSGATAGVAHVFVRHTSCSLTITENADPDVRRDLETLAARWAPDGDPACRHALEGGDDMAAHARSVLTGCSVTVPFADGRLLLGTWQGIFLWEHRTAPQRREVIVTLLA
jgi:secondary thiamine-phosphate synthase enzyme